MIYVNNDFNKDDNRFGLVQRTRNNWTRSTQDEFSAARRRNDKQRAIASAMCESLLCPCDCHSGGYGD